MRTLVDADACPVRGIVERVAAEYGVKVLMVLDRSHQAEFLYAETRYTDTGRDAADIVIINETRRGDIVVTQDYGLAALVLGKGARALDNNGRVFSEKNMGRLLAQRHLNARGHHRWYVRGIRKRTKEDDERFERVYRRLLERSK
jgi:uncharacterized protein YaiI (UPF0178 family)